ncbi:PREDICTED: WRKY transcription factor 44-like [Nelumbo nucifera]|uniref:WRKY domain-containing protein n=2 Tax=Nelumbo nucifera TaxID=4432 RepID=A0A822YLE1_NELNU|nr:PREDICTED: WRKY transcription factor 44-like [Nelumbo nucifera]DAD30168.1 TPA_asm: hypothetical protein HUJ06_031636 [Nelumbo nucifera]
MADPPSTTATLLEAEEGFREDQVVDRECTNLVMPEDGHIWKKYGQKFIKNIGKTRSYFKCQRTDCRAKKRAEWLASDPNNLRIVYQGVHNHPSSTSQLSSSQQGSASVTNQYNLFTQVFGDQDNPS